MHLGLDDLCVRFIVNLPREELESVERICFQIEEAQWFYEDFVRPLDPNLPSLNLRQFCLKIFQHCPLFSGYDKAVHSDAFSEFLAYKTRVPVRGAILLNKPMTEVVLVKGWKKGANWSFPRGKINKDEKDIDCAVREVYEETGYDIRAAGLIDVDSRFIEVTMREQHMKLFVIPDVPMDTHFEPRTRKEISRIQWYKLSDLPTSKKVKQQPAAQDVNSSAHKFYMVAPFLSPLKKIIAQLRKTSALSTSLVAPTAQIMAGESASSDKLKVEPSDVTDNLGTLVNKLRESQQNSASPNSQRMLSLVSSETDPSVRIRDLLKIPNSKTPTLGSAIKKPSSEVARGIQAQALLSLIRSEQNPGIPIPPPQDLSLSAAIPTSQPVPERKSLKGYDPAASSWQMSLPKSDIEHHASGPSGHDVPLSVSAKSIPDANQHEPSQHNLFQDTKSFLPTAPYHHTSDFSISRPLSPGAGLTGQSPAAGKLPIPKLNAHSSSLLGLFRASDANTQSKSTRETHALDDKGLHSLEISSHISQQGQGYRSQALDASEQQHATILGERLDNPSATIQYRTARPQSTHQQSLLSLFRSETSKSSVAADTTSAPVELSASSSKTRDAFSRTQEPQSLVRTARNVERIQTHSRKLVKTSVHHGHNEKEQTNHGGTLKSQVRTEQRSYSQDDLDNTSIQPKISTSRHALKDLEQIPSSAAPGHILSNPGSTQPENLERVSFDELTRNLSRTIGPESFRPSEPEPKQPQSRDRATGAAAPGQHRKASKTNFQDAQFQAQSLHLDVARHDTPESSDIILPPENQPGASRKRDQPSSTLPLNVVGSSTTSVDEKFLLNFLGEVARGER